ncbi:hypothetical protein NA57DRAFT_75798 [Rhizodiscina lignyota]|uniref:Uncharacterized protein n=1 Tax=Rhizodiscina lignyota TaxID=1504668 RepID=A0A9P4IFV2_9PEZI|nr:hypothetical protein NA57DRAFT_75798 [Rhizodiscina lignyota]
MAVSATAAAILGLCGAYFGGMMIMGGVQFFMAGSWIGFVGGSIFFYRTQVRQAFLAFDDYPELMRLHLVMNFPLMRFQRMNLHPDHRPQERRQLEDSWAMTSMLASAYQTASPAIDEILARREQAMITELSKESES